jgi:hypothetical protein
MKLHVRTEDNALYEIDTWSGRWERIEKTEWPGMVRAGGDFWGYTMQEGAPLIIIGPPIATGATYRQITTSPVISVEEIPWEPWCDRKPDDPQE